MLCFPPQLELKYHSFFSPINWDDLMSKKITPPFIPSVVSQHRSGPFLAPLNIKAVFKTEAWFKMKKETKSNIGFGSNSVQSQTFRGELRF